MNRINVNKLTIFNQTTDVSNDLYEFSGTKAISLSASNYLYIGFSKPLHTLYFDVATANTGNKVLKVEKYTDTWVEVDKQDDTNGFVKSGFLFTNELEGETATEINGKTLFWFRLSLGASSTNLALRFIGLVFNNLSNLINAESQIELFYPMEGDTQINSFLGSQLFARDKIIQKLNGMGKYKYGTTPVSLLTEWDFFNIKEVMAVAIPYCLHNIYKNVYDNKDGVEKAKADFYLADGDQAFEKLIPLLTLDDNDDGVIDETEDTGPFEKYTRLGY